MRRVRDGDLEVREPEGEALRADVQAMRQPRILLLRFRPEAEPAQLPAELVPQMVVPATPSACIPPAEVRVVSLRVIPPPPPGLALTASIVAISPPTEPATRQEWPPQPKAAQCAMLAVVRTQLQPMLTYIWAGSVQTTFWEVKWL